MTENRFGDSWWGRQWIDALERLSTVWQNRLPRGKDYAAKGHVLSLTVTSGKVVAKVQGSRSKPYTVTIEMPTIRATDWERVIAELSAEARFPAQLLAGEIPTDVQPIFEKLGLHLFPIRNSELLSNCSCPDRARPCKHIAAVHYSLGEAFDHDPFLLFSLRGADRAAFVYGFYRGWFGNDSPDREELAASNGSSELDGVQVQPLSADRFNRAPEEIPQLSFQLQPPDDPAAILHRLGAPSAWRIPIGILDLLGPVYEEASEQALEIATANASSFFDDRQSEESDDDAHDDDASDEHHDKDSADDEDDERESVRAFTQDEAEALTDDSEASIPDAASLAAATRAPVPIPPRNAPKKESASDDGADKGRGSVMIRKASNGNGSSASNGVKRRRKSRKRSSPGVKRRSRSSKDSDSS